MSSSDAIDVCVVGGCGRAGLPLALAFAKAGLRIGVYDIDRLRVQLVAEGVMPFREPGADELLAEMLAAGRLEVADRPSIVSRSPVVVIVIGTPMDEFLNPTFTPLTRCVDDIARYVAPRSLVVLRSTVHPGTSQWLERTFAERGIDADVAMCPERVTEGYALEELRTLPQIIGADSDAVATRAARLFGVLAPRTIAVATREAELAKLLTNAWRYMKFAVANHFFEISAGAGIDYDQVLRAVREDYPRAADLPGPGYAAGPCLLKDTMQLAAFAQDHQLAQAAMAVNEGLPNFIVQRLADRVPLSGARVGILGMAFKKNSDDTRESLSYKLRKLLRRAGATVLCTDPYVTSEDLVPLDVALAEADVVIVGAPHDAYAGLDLRGKQTVDVWGLLGAIRV